jgi:glucose/arabinose dehydrogenase
MTLNNIFRLISFIVVLSTISCKKKKNGDDNNPPEFAKKTVKQNLNHVWEMLWGPDDYIWFTERDGKISKMQPSTGDIVFTATISEVVPNGEGGLLGMAH